MKKIKLGDVGKVSMCKRILKSQTSPDEEIPFYKISTFGGKADSFISRKIFEEYKKKFSYPKKGDVLISAAGTLGKTVIFDGEEAFFQDSNIVWIDNDESKILNQYLYYFYQLNIWKKSAGSIIDRLYNDDIKNIEIFFPESIEQQKKISSVLSALDKKISLNKKINSTLEQMAKTIYDFYFIQFDFPDENGKPYKSSGGKMIFNDELKRNIPVGWEVVKIGSLVKNSKNGDWGKAEFEKNFSYKVNCLRGADFPAITDGATLEAPTRYISEKNLNRILSDGDIIIEISGGSPTQSTGRICYINDEVLKRFENGIITSNFCKAVSISDKENLYFFYLMWKKFYESGVLFHFEGKTTGIKNLLFDTVLENLKIAIPEKNLLSKFNKTVEKFFLEIQKNSAENQKLADLRDFLLPMLMNGQIEIK